MRQRLNYPIRELNVFAENISNYIDKYRYAIQLRGKDMLNVTGTSIGSKYDLLIGFGAISICSPNHKRFENLSEYLALNDWVFGYFSYDLKNELEDLKSSNFDALEFPEMFFFQPEIVLTVKSNVLSVHYHENTTSKGVVDDLIAKLLAYPNSANSISQNIIFKSRYTKQEYLETIHQVKKHIARGDIYEMNLCQEFYTEGCSIEPSEVFNELYRVSPTPFAAFLKVDNKYLMSASPERYIRKEGDLIISQPIKGTAPRKSNAVDDERVVLELSEDIKERAENVMIVDLVRNDLSKVATRGSVKVNELCGIYTFPQVHQMISTATCKLQPNLSLIEPIKATFPMGSMTGAPKVRAMQLIEEFERTKRGLFSGAVGYFAPNGDFDFNVVIRSLLYNKENRYLSFTVGGAITFNSEPEKEYNECLLKAKAILTTLNATIENAG